jgi:hypothetical protein
MLEWPPPDAEVSTLSKPVGVWRALLLSVSTAAATAAFLPGVAVAVAARVVTARLLGRSITHGQFTTQVGGQVELSGKLEGWTAAAYGLLPLVGLAGLGALLLLPTIVNAQVLGISPLPAVTSDPAVATGDDLIGTLLPGALVTLSPGAILASWAGVSCFYLATPEYAALAEVRFQLRNAGSARRTAKWLRVALAPVAGVRRLLSLLDEIALWLGLNVLIASGTATILLLMSGLSWIARHVYA